MRSLFSKLPFLSTFDTEIVVDDSKEFQEKITIPTDRFNNTYTLENIKAILTIAIENSSSNDTINIFVDEGGDSVATYRGVNGIPSSLENVIFEDDAINYILRIEISKQIENDILYIYSYETFKQWLFNGNNRIQDFLEKIEFAQNQEKVKFKILDEEIKTFYTSKFIFYSVEEPNINPDLSTEDFILKMQKEHCYFSGYSKLNFLPSEFKLLESSNDTAVDGFLNKICFLLTLMYVVDISDIQSDGVYYKLYGYRSINSKLNLSKDCDSLILNQYYGIFEWIYTSNKSSIADKIGLARNVISLHVKDNDFYKLEGNVLDSIKANFDIYLKENVQRYLEVKNQVSSFLYDMSIKAESYSNNLVDTFKTNFLIFISYFLSIIVVSSIDKGKFFNIFTVEVTTITLLMLTISWIYKKSVIEDLKEKINRFSVKYHTLKSSYEDILEKDNLKNLFSEDLEFNSDILYMNNILNKYKKIWEATILAFSILAVILCLTHNTSTMQEDLVGVVSLLISIAVFFSFIE